VVRHRFGREDVVVEKETRTLRLSRNRRLQQLNYSDTERVAGNVERTLVYEFLQRQVRRARRRISEKLAECFRRCAFKVVDEADPESLNFDRSGKFKKDFPNPLCRFRERLPMLVGLGS